MPRFAFGFLLCLAWVGVAQAEDELNGKTCLSAIAHFQDAPQSDLGRKCAGLITRYADESDDVEVVINEKLVPWVGKVAHSETLLAAYIAGNVRTQIETGIQQDDPYSGLVMTISV